MAVERALVTGLLLFACAAESRPAPERPVALPPAPAPVPRPAPAASPSPPPSPPTTALAPEPLPCRPLGLAKACVTPKPREWLDSEAHAKWYSARSAKPPANEVEPVCREVKLGPKAEDALYCERIEHESRGKPGAALYTYRVLALVSVRTVRKGRAVTVLEAPLSFDALDSDDLDQGPFFSLNVEASEPLTSLELSELGDGSCKEAEARLRDDRTKARAENDAVMLAWNRLDSELLARVCRAVGKYAWQNGRLVRDQPLPAGSSGP